MTGKCGCQAKTCDKKKGTKAEKYASTKTKKDTKPKEPNRWVKHCQDYAKKYGCTYRAALTRARPSYGNLFGKSCTKEAVHWYKKMNENVDTAINSFRKCKKEKHGDDYSPTAEEWAKLENALRGENALIFRRRNGYNQDRK